MVKGSGGTFNKLNRPFVRVARQKTREKKKVSGSVEKDKKARELCSGKRTKKHARKMEHRARMNERFQEERQKELEAELKQAEEAQKEADVEMAKPKQKKKKGKGAGKGESGPAPMQE